MTTLDCHGLAAKLDKALRLAQRAVDELLDAKAVITLNASADPQPIKPNPGRSSERGQAPLPFTPSEFDLKRVDL